MESAITAVAVAHDGYPCDLLTLLSRHRKIRMVRGGEVTPGTVPWFECRPQITAAPNVGGNLVGVKPREQLRTSLAALVD